MNPSDFDHPDLTAYALGELDGAEAARVRQMLARSPEARHEYDRIQQAVAALKQGRSMPRRALSARQRETVLAMAQIPVRSSSNVVPFKQTRPQPASILWRTTKYAAAACLAVGAFFIGQKSVQRGSGVVAGNSPAPASEAAIVPPSPVVEVVPARSGPSLANDLVLKDFEVVLQEAPDAAPAPAGVESVTNTRPPMSAPTGPLVAKAEPPVPVAAAPAHGRLNFAGFTQTSDSPDAVIAFHPRMVKPEPVVFAGVVLAAKAPLVDKSANSNNNNNNRKKSDSQPPLIVHSWKSEIASCPWDSSRRLMRFVAQIPVDQDAMDEEDGDYRLVAKFDPTQVQAYRLVTEKHTRPGMGGTQATRFAWYEIIPTRNFRATQDKPAAIGTVEIVQPRGTPANKEGSTLKLLDRGQNWNDAREDFVFETAMVGFNQLLQGTVNTSGLNHKVVLDLAEKTKGEDAKGERAKFIQTVKQAQRAAGL